MSRLLVFCLLCVQLHFGVTQNVCSNITFPKVKTISEETAKGTTIFELNHPDTADETNPWELNPPNHDFFMFSYRNGFYQLLLEKQIKVNCTKQREIPLIFQCGSLTQNVSIIATYKDRFPPDWRVAESSITVSEDDNPGKVLLSVSGDVQDDDCYDEYVVDMKPSLREVLKPKEYFSFNSTTEQIILSREIDYDEMICNFGFGKLNVAGQLSFDLIVSQPGNQNNQKDRKVTVTFTGIDDEPPVFVKEKDCSTCLSACKASASTAKYKADLKDGVLNNFTYYVYAKDFDTPNADLVYRLVEVQPDQLSNYVSIDEENGTISVQLSPEIIVNTSKELNKDIQDIKLILQVIDSQANQTSDNLTMTLDIELPVYTTTTYELTKHTTSTDLMTETSSEISEPSTTYEVTKESSSIEMTTETYLTTNETHTIRTESATTIDSFTTVTSPFSTTYEPKKASETDKTVSKVFIIILALIGGLVVLVAATCIALHYWRKSGKSYVMKA